jgi:hypothetical protein
MPYIIGRKTTRKNKFLNELAQGWSVSKAAVAAGISRSQAYRWRETDLKFAATWDEATEVGADALEDVASIRAKDVEFDVLDKDGKVVGKKIEHNSDRMLELMLKAKRPHVYARPDTAVQQIVKVTMPTLADMRKKYQELGLTPPVIEGDFKDVDKGEEKS